MRANHKKDQRAGLLERLTSCRLKHGRINRKTVLVLSLVTFVAAVFLFTIGANAVPASFSVLDARERDVIKTGKAKGTVTPTYDESIGVDVLEFDYSVAPDSNASVVMKSFPAELADGAVNTAKVGVKLLDVQHTQTLTILLELRGTHGTESIPVALKSGWAYALHEIDWKKIGSVKEAVLIVSSSADVKGTLSFSLDFITMAKPAPVKVPVETVNTTVESVVAPVTEKIHTEIVDRPTIINFLDAGKRGVDVKGSAKASALPTYSDALSKDILEIDYSIGKDASVDVWTKSFPATVDPHSVNALQLGIRIPESDQAGGITARLELKGQTATQVIPVTLKTGWNALQEKIDWTMLGGTLEQLSLVLENNGEAENIKGYFECSLFFVFSKAIAEGTTVQAFPAAFTHMDASAKGMFNIHNATGIVGVEFSDEVGKDILKFDYTAEIGSYVGVWTQGYPRELAAPKADALKIGVYLPRAEQVKDLVVSVEIKGAQATQIVPVKLHSGWNFTRAIINWNIIGELKEVVYVTSPKMQIGGSSQVSGTVYFDLDFYKLTFVEKYFTYIKLFFVFFCGLLLSLLSAIFLATQKPRERKLLANDTDSSFGEKIKRDFFYGIMCVAIVGLALGVHALGRKEFLDAGVSFTFLGIGLLGTLIANIWKLKFTNQHLTPQEVFQNFIISALLAASSGRQDLLQAPSSWSQIFIMSNVTATVAFLIYHFCNARSFCKFGRQMRVVTSLVIALTPYLFGWLLIVQNVNLLALLGNGITFGLGAKLPILSKILGRVIILFGFNVLLANAIGMMTKGRLLDTKKAYTLVLFVSLGVVVAPHIADLGSGAWVSSLPILLQAIVAILTTMAAYAGLWAEVYLVTGMMLDAGKRTAPTEKTLVEHISIGTKKGLAYSGFLVALMYAVQMIVGNSLVLSIMAAAPIVIGVLSGILLFPLVKTIIESFDGSLPFAARVKFNYQNWVLYARGAVVGFGFSYMISNGMFQETMSERILFGLIIGLVSSIGISIVRDSVYASRGQGKIQSWRLYLIDGLLGGFIGSAVAFYLDTRQVPVIIEKFKLYTSSGFSPIEYITYPLVNKWGRIDLGSYAGGSRLLFTESLAGVINWSIAAWLFAINKVFMQAYFEKQTQPIKFFFSRAGFANLIEHMIYVLRWGLWMSPIIFTFLRMMPSATWYNQDGALRTLLCVFNNATMSPEAFQTWSLNVFIYMLAFDALRILIWMDHMGLRVATLVNLSFLGLDRLDEKVAKFIGPAATQRYIPEAVKRFCTWAPLLIPFYLPRGAEWDYAWNTSIAMQNARGEGLIAAIQNLPFAQKALLALGAVIVIAIVSYALRLLMNQSRKKKVRVEEIANREYTVVIKESGEIYSQIDHQKRGVYPPEYDLTRRSYDPMHPCGRILFVVDTAAGGKGRASSWPIIGNFPLDRFEASSVEKKENEFFIANTSNGVSTSIKIALPDSDSKAEIWTITLENLTDEERSLKVVPYCEWVLNGGLHDRFHTQYARLFPEMDYIRDINAVLAWQKGTSSMGILACESSTEGFLASRLDFIGRGRSIWNPRIFETLHFLPADNIEKPYPTFDPIGSLLIDAKLGSKEKKEVRILIGYETNKEKAINLVKKHLRPTPGKSVPESKKKERPFLIGHGEIPPGTPQPYSEYTNNGRTLTVHTPFTTRPYDHALSNSVGHSVMVTNRGLHTSCNGNSQQNRVTPDWPDTVTKEVPTEAIFLYDPASDEWFSPTHEPILDPAAKNTCEFSVDGTAVFHMTKGTLATELTVFTPQKESAGLYLLKIKNTGKEVRTLRVSPYFQMVLSFQAEQAGTLTMKHDTQTDALYFYNPRNMFRKGWAFVSTTMPVDALETNRGKYFGKGRGLDRPFMVEKGRSDESFLKDEGQVASFVSTVKIPAGGEYALAIVLGQTDEREEAEQVVSKYKNLANVYAALKETRDWWLNFVGTSTIETNLPEFDQLQDWLKYQAIAERIWPRRGFYQTSGAFGYRDQLQDTVNLMWVDPALARKQIILHASHQFPLGDVYHWFFTLTDGRTAFACRSHASDNPLWLSWSVAEYVNATGDKSILDEMTSYVLSEFPFGQLPKNKHGVGHLYHRSTLADTVYRHCMCSIDLVLNKRLGKNGLPLIQTGDWNDGLDEIGSKGIGESVWLGFFLYYILTRLLDIIEEKDGEERRAYYADVLEDLKASLEATWREDRYLRAFHDDGTEIGIKGSGIWEIDALTVAWAVYCGINPEREEIAFQTAIDVLERDNAVLLGWPALREDSKPYLGRSSHYPEGVRENGMYCHGVQWMIKASRILVERAEAKGDKVKAAEYREIGLRLWKKITPVGHVTPEEIEIYGGQPNKQQADVLTNYDCGRMIWNGYTGAAGWLLRQSYEGIIGAQLVKNRMILPTDLDKPRGKMKIKTVKREIEKSPLKSMSQYYK
jgi:cyclic beta-1,2-glucan synthetase